jgi:hypothetical protein
MCEYYTPNAILGTGDTGRRKGSYPCVVYFEFSYNVSENEIQMQRKREYSAEAGYDCKR